MSDDVEALKAKVAEWANSPEGQQALIQTQKDIQAVIDDLAESRKLDPKLLNEPMTI